VAKLPIERFSLPDGQFVPLITLVIPRPGGGIFARGPFRGWGCWSLDRENLWSNKWDTVVAFTCGLIEVCRDLLRLSVPVVLQGTIHGENSLRRRARRIECRGPSTTPAHSLRE
jgi:hypothetical protein